ncbi:hypothetical protein [Flavobacterium crassostreae]|uniref:Uncharacterized protein n=1 Tax=Flavobacterium crassostreae TaxID=1763534 RepID=A0A1B9E7R9_9FLAO|nr:hypothetical protein [Flavobacterium crassostreae]OCB77983.1 hypothetical protein LPBF_03275 [Flavobacterium crassostreae]
MRFNTYYGTLWIIFQAKNPQIDDDIVSVKLENLFRTRNEFRPFSIGFKNPLESFRVTIFSVEISIYVR